MKRHLPVTLLVVLAVAPLIAQAPKGWILRVDRSTSPSDPDARGDIKFVAKGSAVHVTAPKAAVFWNPANTVSGTYTLKGTFTLMEPSSHTNYYGLMFGGRDLDGPEQRYLYFIVAQNGTWLVKSRDGDAVSTTLTDRTPNNAVRKPGRNGKSTNALEVRVMADKIAYLVNGTTVHTSPRTGHSANTDGIYGIRVNHLLEVQVDGFGVSTPYPGPR